MKKLLFFLCCFIFISSVHAEMNAEKSLFNAIEKENIKEVKTLIKQGANVNIADENGKTPLHIAANKGNLKLVKLLVKNGANVNAKSDGANPLYFAIFAESDKNSRILKYLIKKGANVNTQMDNFTALWMAAHKGQEKTVEILLKNGADINYKTNLSSNPIEAIVTTYNADIKKKEKILKIMIKYGADINMPTSDTFRNLTVLDYAVSNEKLDLQKMLIKLGAKSNYPIINLHVQNNNIEMVKFLIKNGFALNNVDYKGNTTLDYAQTEEMKQLLISHGAKSGKELKELK